jgi:hypothetical protein
MDEQKTKDLILPNSDEIWQMRGGIKAPAGKQVTIDFALQRYVLLSR